MTQIDFNELMDRDPLELTKEDLSAIVQRIRAGQDKWRADAFQGTKAKAKAKSKTPTPTVPALSLGDLGL